VKLNSRPSSAEVKECVELYLHLPNTPSWRGAQLKHRDNFTVPYLTEIADLELITTLPPHFILGLKFDNYLHGEETASGTYLDPLDPVHKLTSYCFNIRFNTILPSMLRSSKWSLPFRVYTFFCISHLSHACYLPSSHFPWFDHPHDTWGSIQIMNPLILQSSASSLSSQNILLIILHSNLLNLCSSVNMRDEVHTRIKQVIFQFCIF